MSQKPTRRDFMQTTLAAAAASSMPYWFLRDPAAAKAFQSPNDRPLIACIGTGDRWNAVGPAALRFGDCVAVCDVDAEHAQKGKKRVEEIQNKKGNAKEVKVYENYLDLLDKHPETQIVTVVTPDHWHSKISIDAMKHGKDVYCEKPLTLTIEEGKQIIKVLEATKRVFQVGTQQRSEMSANGGKIHQQFLVAVALARLGRLGKIQRVECRIGGAPTSSEIPKAEVPKHLNWDLWLGQAPMTDYLQGGFGNNKNYPESRTHYEFRWWYEYSGGKLTDWGAHHVDIATWAIGMENSGPVSVEGEATHPVPFEKGWPTVSNRYNTATSFKINVKYPNGVEMLIRNDEENGILIEGSEGRIFVSRGSLKGKPVEDLATNPLPADAIVNLYKGKQPGDHMRNFFECCVDRTQPISDVYTHHRAMTTCHLSNIAIRLGRKLNWDAEKQEIIGDAEAKQWQAREQRKGYEIQV